MMAAKDYRLALLLLTVVTFVAKLSAEGPPSSTPVDPDSTASGGGSTTDTSGARGIDNSISGGNSQCSDQNPLCPFWAVTGECLKNRPYMERNCYAACTNCASPQIVMDCQNKVPQCAEWQANGECDKNAAYMVVQCALACQFCTSSGAAPYPNSLYSIFPSA